MHRKKSAEYFFSPDIRIRDTLIAREIIIRDPHESLTRKKSFDILKCGPIHLSFNYVINNMCIKLFNINTK